VFLVSGALLGTWVSRLPATRDRLHASGSELGLALLVMGLGSLSSMPVTGTLCRRFGSRAMVAVTAVPACAVLASTAFVPSLLTLTLALYAYGLLYGAWDVSMNVHGSAVELAAGRAWMPRYHACWSAGVIFGAAAGGLAARVGMPVTAQFPLVAGVCAVLVLAALRTFVPERPEPATADTGPVRWRGVLTRRVLLIGVITLCATTVEGAAADWLALYLVDDRRVSASLAANGFATFSFAMAAGRFVGTSVIERLGRHGAVRAGGLVSIVGVLLTVFGPSVVSAYAGAVCWALGVCLIFPAAMSAAGESPLRAPDAIAIVATFGYGGLLVGPPLIGVLADHVRLGRALLVLVVLGAAIAVLAPAARPLAPVDRDSSRRRG
jgi:predicted MFS family arabinose efflux permease